MSEFVLRLWHTFACRERVETKFPNSVSTVPEDVVGSGTGGRAQTHPALEPDLTQAHHTLHHLQYTLDKILPVFSDPVDP
jgi:hypothetical protein